MERRERISAALAFDVLVGENAIRFAPSDQSMGKVCLALALLWHELITQVVFECDDRRFLIIDVDSRLTASDGSIGVWSPPKARLTLSRNDLESCVAFALKYYRDGVGEVDHFDLEVRDAPGGMSVMSVTFVVPGAKPPLSPEEMQRLL